MSKTILIDTSNVEETRVAVTENGKLDDFEIESNKKNTVKGDVYLAKITRVEPSLQAAFVDFGNNRNGFLPLTEIHPDYFKIPTSDQNELSKLTKKLSNIENKDIEENDDGNSNEEIIFIYPASSLAHKNHITLIKAFSQLKEESTYKAKLMLTIKDIVYFLWLLFITTLNFKGKKKL